MAEKSQTKAAAAMADDKKRAIETAMQQIERTYGKGSIMPLWRQHREQCGGHLYGLAGA